MLWIAAELGAILERLAVSLIAQEHSSQDLVPGPCDCDPHPVGQGVRTRQLTWFERRRLVVAIQPDEHQTALVQYRTSRIDRSIGRLRVHVGRTSMSSRVQPGRVFAFSAVFSSSKCTVLATKGGILTWWCWSLKRNSMVSWGLAHATGLGATSSRTWASLSSRMSPGGGSWRAASPGPVSYSLFQGRKFEQQKRLCDHNGSENLTLFLLSLRGDIEWTKKYPTHGVDGERASIEAVTVTVQMMRFESYR